MTQTKHIINIDFARTVNGVIVEESDVLWGSAKDFREYSGSLPESILATLDQSFEGHLVLVRKGRSINSPLSIAIDSQPTEENKPTAVILESGCSATLIMRIRATVDEKLNLRRELFLGEWAKLTVYELFDADHGSRITTDNRSTCQAGSTLVSIGVETSRGHSEHNYRTSLAGSGSRYNHSAVFIAGAEEQKSFDVCVEHLVADCQSDVLVKGIASSTGSGNFKGMVYVAQDAQRTEAYQQSRNILIGDKARIQTSPQLEIYADDVRCSHGATVGQMDDESIYYMRQRGLSEQQARALRMAGFVREVVDRIDDSEFHEYALSASMERVENL